MTAERRRFIWVVAAVLAYLPAAWVAGILTLPPGRVVTFRPPNALLLALALIDTPGRAWLYALATVPANPTIYTSPLAWIAIAGYMTANAIEVGIAATLVRRLVGRAPRFDEVRDCAMFVMTVAVACAASATVGAATVSLASRSAAFSITWRNWFLADALSHLVIVPLVVLGARDGQLRASLTGGREALAISAGLVALTPLAMSGQIGDVATYPGLVYLPLPFLVWAAIRFSTFETALAVFAVCGVILGTAIARVGAFEELSSADAALSMQLLLLMIALPVMFLAASVDERRRSADLVKKAFHANPAGMAMTAVADGRIIEMNDSFERLLGYTRAEVIGRTTEEIGIWVSLDDRRRALDLLREQGRLRDLPALLRRRDGQARRMLLSAERVEGEEREAMLAILTDVTDQQRAEELKAQVQSQMQQTDRLEALGQLAGGIAHDFNNVLQAVKGYTELALESLTPNHPAVSPLSHVNAAADRAATFTGHLLAFSRRDAPRTERLSLNALVTATGGLLQHALGGHVQVAIVAAPSQPTIHGDRARIEQVLMNLCINARDAMTAGGTITIETGEVELSAEACESRPWARPGHWAFLRVVDRGAGIPDAVRPHIFEPFFTTKPPGHGGSGLGLSTVYAIVERHRGLISVDSTAGAGSTFTVYFPNAGPMPAVASAPVRGEAPLHGRGETILLAEDEPSVRDLAVEMLQSANYDVLVAGDGAEAETIIRARAADLDAVVIDVVMPHRNGRQVYDTLRSLRPEVPVVFCTGYSFGELNDLEQITGRSVLSKPYSRASLLGAVRGAIDTARSFRTNRVRD